MSIQIENTQIFGWESAIRGMRNPLNSWAKSDSGICYKEIACHTYREDRNKCLYNMGHGSFVIGQNDLDLMTRLRKAGTDHRKFMRMIVVYMDVTAPLYLWKEFDTYKVGTVANSCSTMHKIHAKEFSLDDFSCEHILSNNVSVSMPESLPLIEGGDIPTWDISTDEVMDVVILALNCCREKYLKTKDKIYWWQMVQLLPSSYNQKRTVMLNYEVLANMYESRKNHKLDEWHTFCDWIKTLPYSELIIGEFDDEL